jgi:glycosyltransferase involved in cell wall biosynthesis
MPQQSPPAPLSGDDPGVEESECVAVFLAQNLGRGGAERVFVHLVNHIRAPRPVPVLVQTLAPLAGELDSSVQVSTLSNSNGRMPSDGNPVNGFARLLDRLDEHPAGQVISLPIKAWRLRRIVRDRDAGVVCSFLPKAHLVAALARPLGLRDRVFVANVHCFMSQHIHHHFAPITRVLARTLLGFALRRADGVFAVSRGVREDVIRTLRLDPARVHVVWNPLDLDHIRSSAEAPIPTAVLPEAEPGCHTLVGVGRLTSLKAFHLAIEALAHIPSDLPVRLVLVGEGPAQDELAALARRLGVQDAVHLVGAQSNPWPFMARADLLVHPSKTEAFPNVFGEAMALGVPILATDCSPGVREYLEDGASGRTVPPDDVGALAREIVTMLTDPAGRMELAERGARRVAGFELKSATERHGERLLQVARQRRETSSRPQKGAS